MVPVVVVYRGRVITKGAFNVLPRVGDYIKVDGGTCVVEAIVIDCTKNNNGGAIVYIRDTTIAEANKLSYLNS